MSWGPCFMSYHGQACGKKFKYAADMIPVFGEKFGACPYCGGNGVFEKDGARTLDDADYPEVEE